LFTQCRCNSIALGNHQHPVEAKTSIQVKNEKKGADAKAKTNAKTQASKAKSAAKKTKQQK